MSLRLVANSAARQAKWAVVGTGIRNSRVAVPRRFKSATPTASAESAALKAEAKLAEADASTSSVPIGKCVAALAAAVTTVAAGAAAVEQATASSVPDFTLDGQRFDQSTFLGRFSRMFLMCDPRLLTYTEADVLASRDLVNNHKELIANPPSTDSNIHRTLWEAQRIASSSLHPDSGDTIPAPFRMSGYVPFNGPICVAMVASQSTSALLFWSWVNQSQNALVNYYNRNASSPMSNETLMQSYAAAVGAALTVAFGLATIIQKRYDAKTAKSMLRWVAFPSAVVASSLNCYIVRSPEIGHGIPLMNDRGENVLEGETSNEAAQRGVHLTTLSRAICQAPVYFLPPVLLASIPILKRIAAKNPALTIPMTTYLVLCSFGCGLPLTLAIFPQMSEIKASEAEEKFQNLRDPKTGLPYEKFLYNKGL